MAGYYRRKSYKSYKESYVYRYKIYKRLNAIY